MTTEKRSVNDRKGVLGCSDIGAVYDASTYKSARDVAEAFLGKEKAVTPEQQMAFDMGHALEPVVADLITRFYGIRLRSTQNRYLCKAEPRLGCHPDRFVKGHNDQAVEIKTSSAFDSGRWGEADSDEVPYDYLLQCYGYFICIPRISLVYLFRFSNNRLTRYIIHRPEQSVLDGIVAHLTEWMDKVTSGWMPEPRSYREAVRAFSPKEGSAEAPEGILTVISQYNGLSEQIKAMEDKQDILKLSLVKFLEEASASSLYDPSRGKTVCTYQKIERTSVDSKKLAELYPSIAEECSKTSEYNQLKISKAR